jgi:hypothetical protein
MFGRVVLALLVAAALMVNVLADEATVQRGGVELPAELGDSMQAALNPEVITVQLDGKPVAHIWLAKELQAAKSANSELGVSFGGVAQGGLVGVVVFPEPWSDYKKNPIGVGTYTMRYAVMPADGNHMGVATFRDFLLLLPPSVDSDPSKALGMAELLVGSGEATGVVHPGVLALYPIWEEVSEPSVSKNDLDQWTLAVKIGSQVLGLVISGHGEI